MVIINCYVCMWHACFSRENKGRHLLCEVFCEILHNRQTARFVAEPDMPFFGKILARAQVAIKQSKLCDIVVCIILDGYYIVFSANTCA